MGPVRSESNYYKNTAIDALPNHERTGAKKAKCCCPLFFWSTIEGLITFVTAPLTNRLFKKVSPIQSVLPEIESPKASNTDTSLNTQAKRELAGSIMKQHFVDRAKAKLSPEELKACDSGFFEACFATPIPTTTDPDQFASQLVNAMNEQLDRYGQAKSYVNGILSIAQQDYAQSPDAWTQARIEIYQNLQLPLPILSGNIEEFVESVAFPLEKQRQKQMTQILPGDPDALKMTKRKIQKAFAASDQRRANLLRNYTIEDRQLSLSQVMRFCEERNLPYDQIPQAEYQKFKTKDDAERAERQYNRVLAEESKASVNKQGEKTAPVRRKKPLSKNIAKSASAVKQDAAEKSRSATASSREVALPSDEVSRFLLCQQWFAVASFAIHWRVSRWKTNDIESIRDWDAKYKSQTPNKLAQSKRYHDLPGTEKLILNPCYAFKTTTGYGMLSRIVVDGAAPVDGTLYFGIDDSDKEHPYIYHRFFEEQDSTVAVGKILSGPELDQPLEKTLEREEEEKHISLYEKSVSEKGIIQIRYPSKRYSIFVYPVREDLLPHDIFSV